MRPVAEARRAVRNPKPESAGSSAGAFVSAVHVKTGGSSFDWFHALTEPEKLFHVMPSMHKMKRSPLAGRQRAQN
jgi:hypothetical protein